MESELVSEEEEQLYITLTERSSSVKAKGQLYHVLYGKAFESNIKIRLMKFTFKMFVLVGLILVGKFLKEDNTTEIVKDQNKGPEEVYSLKSTDALPFTQKTNHHLQPVIKQVSADKTFTYRLN